MQLAVWFLLLVLVRDERPWLTAAVLALSIAVKFDTVLIALLYGLTISPTSLAAPAMQPRRRPRLRHA